MLPAPRTGNIITNTSQIGQESGMRCHSQPQSVANYAKPNNNKIPFDTQLKTTHSIN